MPHKLAATRLDKWNRYYDNGRPPWDSFAPSSQLQDFLCTCVPPECRLAPAAGVESILTAAVTATEVVPPPPDMARMPHICSECAAWKPPQGGAVLELGCGSGGAAAWLASAGYRVTGVDVCETALQQAAATAAATPGCSRGNPVWLRADLLAAAAASARAPAAADGACTTTTPQHDAATAALTGPGAGLYDLIYDCQTYHALLRDAPDAAAGLPAWIASHLAPGGLLLMLTGCDREPEIGPAVLSAGELLLPLAAAGLKPIFLRISRFDETPHYQNVLGCRPAAWWLLMRKPCSDDVDTAGGGCGSSGGIGSSDA